MATPQGGAKSTTGTDISPANFANTLVALTTLANARLGWIIRNPIGNTQTLYLRFAITAGSIPITDALAHWALAPGDLVNDGVVGYCGPIWGSFSGAVSEGALVVVFT